MLDDVEEKLLGCERSTRIGKQKARPARSRRVGQATTTKGRFVIMAKKTNSARGVGQKHRTWLEQFKLWHASEIGQKTIINNLYELAHLMGIREEDRERFCAETWFFLNAVLGGVLTLQVGYKDVALADAELKIRAAQRAVSKLCDAKEKYSEFNWGSDIKPKTLEDCEAALSQMVAAFAVMTDSFWGDIPESGPGSRDLRKNWVFERLVTSLFIKSENNGSRLTFSHNNGTGTIFKALELLRPFFPPDFIPPAPLNAIRRAKNQVERIKKLEAEFTNSN